MFSKFFIKFRIPILFILVFILVFAPVLANASSDTLSFDLWSPYRPLITFVDSQGVSHNVSVTDTNVYRRDNTVVIDNAQPLNDDINYPYFRTVSLDVPYSGRSARTYISDLYLNRSFTMSVNVHISSNSADYTTINNISLNSAQGILYTNVSGSTSVIGSISDLSFVKLSDDVFEVSYNLTFIFDKPTYIYGFYFSIRGIFDYNVVGEVQDWYSFYTRFTLSDLFLTNDLTADQIQDSVSQGIISGTGGNDYIAPDDSSVDQADNQEQQIVNNIDQYKQSSLDSSDFDLYSKLDSSDLLDLKSTMIGLSNLVTDKFINKLPFSTVIYFAIGLGAFGFLFGLATWSVGALAKNNSFRSSRSRRRGG